MFSHQIWYFCKCFNLNTVCHLFSNILDLTVVKGYWLVVSVLYSLFLRYTSPDFLYVRSWLPCIFFSGGVTVGNIGRQLAMVRNISSYFLLQPFFLFHVPWNRSCTAPLLDYLSIVFSFLECFVLGQCICLSYEMKLKWGTPTEAKVKLRILEWSSYSQHLVLPITRLGSRLSHTEISMF